MLVQFIVENFWLLLSLFIMLHFKWLSLVALMITLVKAGLQPLAVAGIIGAYLLLSMYDSANS